MDCSRSDEDYDDDDFNDDEKPVLTTKGKVLKRKRNRNHTVEEKELATLCKESHTQAAVCHQRLIVI
jgi:hypothetical protein